MSILTHSAMSTARQCLRKYWYRYEAGLRRTRDAQPLRIGSAMHLGLELFGKGVDVGEAVAQVAEGYASIPDWAILEDWYVERETVEALLVGYAWRWANEPLDLLEVEGEWAMPLVNPETSQPSRTWTLAGKRDGICRMHDGRLAVREAKTTGEDIGPDSDYWLRLRGDQQISLYMLAARNDGHDVQTVLYDVIRKPSIRPRQIPQLDSDGHKQVVDADGERVYLSSGKPRQSAGEGMTLLARRETPEEYGARLLTDIEERPGYYYQRREVPRLEADLEECRYEVWQQGRLLADCRRHGRWFRSVNGLTCPFCEYAEVCLNSIAVDPANPPEGFEVAEDVHPELKGE